MRPSILHDCAERFGTPPRRFPLTARLGYLRLPRPGWLRANPDDELNVLFRCARSLLREGVLVWGHVVQANGLLFEPGTDHAPGELVYSLADDRVDPDDLAVVARGLFDLKGTHPEPPALASIAHYLTDERIRVHGLEVPRSIARGAACLVSTTFFIRWHLPGRRLRRPLMPIIVNPRPPHVALPLPERYWPDDLRAWWLDPG